MNKIATLTIACFIATSMLKAQTFSDDFESYTSGIALGPQSPDWRTWTGAGGGADDVDVATTDNHTTAGSKSLYFLSTTSTGGPSDVILPFNTTPLTSGQFVYTMWLKIPSGNSGYFNFQGNATMGNLYTFECFMGGTYLDIMDNGSAIFSTTYPMGTWFELSIHSNLTTGLWEMFIDGVSQGTWMNPTNSVYAIDIYPANDSASYWVDDVSYTVGSVGINESNNSESSINIYPNPMNENTSLILNLSREAAVETKIFSTTGALISNETFGNLSGKVSLPIATSKLSPGIYFMTILVDGQTSMRKLIKE